VTTELTQAEKCGLLMVKLQSPLPTLSNHVFQRSIPAGFFAPRFPTTTTKTPVQRLTVARSTRVELRWQRWCVRYRFATITAEAQVIVDVSKITCDQFVHPENYDPQFNRGLVKWLL
jgi:hypothetical protein